MNDDARLKSLFDEVASGLCFGQPQPRSAIVRESLRRYNANANDVAAIHVIAAANLLDGKPTRSLSLLQRDASFLAGNAQGQRLAGYACLIQQQWDQAILHFDAAVRIDPCQYDGWARLGEILERSGEHERAIRYYKRALVFDDRNHESALALSRIYSARRNLRDAIDTLRVSLLRDRRNPRLNLALARLLEKRALLLRGLKRFDAEHRALCNAADCYEVVAASAPSTEVCISLGLLQNQLSRFDRARRAFTKAVELDPQSPAALSHLGGSLVDHGEIEDALVLFRQSLQLDPRRAVTHFRYTRAKRFQQGSETQQYVQSLERMIGDEPLSPREQVHLKFALAKVLDDTGQYQDAWRHYDDANRLKQRHHPAGKKKAPPLVHVVDEARRVFNRELYRGRRDYGSDSALPIFIIGMPRSGTTLTEQILSSHPQVAGAGELKQIDRLRQRMLRDLSTQSHSSGHQWNQSTSQRSPTARLAACNVSGNGSGHATDSDLVACLDAGSLAPYAQRYLSVLEQYRGEARHVTDKMPTNFLHLGLIALLFPNARVIHCRRNPMDVLVSAFCQNLNPPFCDLSAMVIYHRQYRRLMAHWQSVLPLQIHTVDYECLVSDPEPEVRGMLRHCGLPWRPECLSFHDNRRSVHTPSKWQVRQPMYRTSINRWMRFESQLRPYADQIEREIAVENDLAGLPVGSAGQKPAWI